MDVHSVDLTRSGLDVKVIREVNVSCNSKFLQPLTLTFNASKLRYMAGNTAPASQKFGGSEVLFDLDAASEARVPLLQPMTAEEFNGRQHRLPLRPILLRSLSIGKASRRMRNAGFIIQNNGD